MSLENKTLLITGASDGIGKAVAKQAAADGATVILHGKTQPKLENVYDEIVNAGHPEPLIYPLDLEKATPEDFLTMQEAIDKEFKRLDGLVINAGWAGASSPVQQFDTRLWHRVMQINLNAAFMLTQACLPLLNKAESAAVVFTLDDKKTAYWGAYGVAKAGLQAFMEILNDELDNTAIQVNGIDPGVVRTSFRTRAFPGENPNNNKTPETVVPYYIRLLAGRADIAGGEIIKVDEAPA